MDKFLNIYKLPKWNRNLNRPITSTEIESVIKNPPTNKSSGLDGFPGECHQTFKAELTSILLKLFQKYKWKEHTQTHSTSPEILDSKTKDLTKKNYRPNSLMNMDTKILNKILANQIQQYIKRIIHHNQVGFIPGIQGWFNRYKSINVIHHINKKKKKGQEPLDPLNRCWKCFWQNTVFFLDKNKNPQKSRERRINPQDHKSHIWENHY